ncbi:MAG: hypothetical protein HGA85_01320 [Nanoarchaeota archaeon]|nr:hypothetical protein [Nanoarchaeota archaeon]
MRAQIWISVIIYTLVALLAIVIMLSTGLPIMTEMKDRAVYTKTKDVMTELDRHIVDLSGQGDGAQSEVSFEVREGAVKFEGDKMVWEIETKSRMVSPRSSSRFGNLIIASNANVRTYETASSYIMETTIHDDNFSVEIAKLGTHESWVPMATSALVTKVSYNGAPMPSSGSFNFSINGLSASSVGNGYTELQPSSDSSNLGRAKVVAHMNTTFAYYDLEFILESYSDFVIVRMKNFEPK